MKGISTIGERDREATERRLLDTIGKMIAEDGFEKIGINAIATQPLFLPKGTNRI